MINNKSKYKYYYNDFKVGTRVKIICDYKKGFFWHRETGVVEENIFGNLGIKVRFDKPREFKTPLSTYIQIRFNFDITDLEPLNKIYCMKCKKIR